ncbi:putative membrane protein, partial [Acinetobacter baumannii 754286]
MPANRCDDFLGCEPFPCIVCIVMSFLDFLVLSFYA